MQRVRRVFVGLACVTGVSLTAAAAAAHIDLLEPEARAHGTAAMGDQDVDANTDQKRGPCGQVVPGRTDRVATYAPGQHITVRVREESPHPSYLRVSLALDGDDFPLRSQPASPDETPEQAEAAERALGGDTLLSVYREYNDTPGFVHEIGVTLPDATCENCTLQVIQFMYDRPAAPFYFQCADLVIARASAAPDAGAEDSPEPAEVSGSAPATGSLGVVTPPSETSDGSEAATAEPPKPVTAAAAPAAGSAPAATAPSAGTAVSNTAVVTRDTDADSGCDMSGSRRGSSTALGGVLSLLGLACARRRRA